MTLRLAPLARLAQGKRDGLPASGFRLRALSRPLAVLWLAGTVVTWNMVFDAHIVKGARDYVDRQQLFVEGRGPRQDMVQMMAAARASGVRAASGWAAVELAPGIALAAALRARNRRRARCSPPRASR